MSAAVRSFLRKSMNATCSVTFSQLASRFCKVTIALVRRIGDGAMRGTGEAKAAAKAVLKPARVSDMLWRAAAPCDVRTRLAVDRLGVAALRLAVGRLGVAASRARFCEPELREAGA